MSARSETYPRPGALPDVIPGSLGDDLYRRDFTVNAIAFVLHGESAGEIIDPHNGQDDLAAERIRAIRPGSFTEDPSRVVRALRYSARLGFRMDQHTELEVRAAAGDVVLSHGRVADEVARLLNETSAPAGLGMAEAIGLPWPDSDPLRDDRLAALDVALARPGAPAPTVWALRLGLGVRPEAAEAASLPQWARAIAREVREGLALGVALAERSVPSEIDAVLRDQAPAVQVGAFIAGASAVSRWWAEWRDLAPLVTGTDLVAAGIAPGPVIGRCLQAVRAAALDGSVHDREGQMALALAEARRGR